MSAFLLDNLIAVVVGTVLVVTLLTLRVRDQQEAVSEVISHGVRVQVHEAFEVIGDDLENMWSPEEAVEASGTSLDASALNWDADTLSSGFTQRFRFPASVQLDTTATNRALAEVTYELIPSTDTVWVSATAQFRHTLVRTVSFARLTPAYTPQVIRDTLSRDLIDLRLGYVEGVDDTDIVWDGPAPPATHSVYLSATAARPGPRRLSQEQANVGFTNAVSYGTTYSPKNL